MLRMRSFQVDRPRRCAMREPSLWHGETVDKVLACTLLLQSQISINNTSLIMRPAMHPTSKNHRALSICADILLAPHNCYQPHHYSLLVSYSSVIALLHGVRSDQNLSRHVWEKSIRWQSDKISENKRYPASRTSEKSSIIGSWMGEVGRVTKSWLDNREKKHDPHPFRLSPHDSRLIGNDRSWRPCSWSWKLVCWSFPGLLHRVAWN